MAKVQKKWLSTFIGKEIVRESVEWDFCLSKESKFWFQSGPIKCTLFDSFFLSNVVMWVGFEGMSVFRDDFRD